MPGSVAALAGVRAGLSPSWATRMDGSNGWSVPFGKRDSTAPAH
jgi:hypothetical protein